MELSKRTDSQLLEEIAKDGSEACFQELVRRYAPMVLGVCRRRLGDVHEAEDAAQAVFLVLWQKVPALRRRGHIGGWLHRVAQNIARNCQRAREARVRHEQHVKSTMQNTCHATDRSDEALELLDEEVDRLPEKFRLPVILFHLEGRSLEEAAALLNLKNATLRMRLSRARELLRNRLIRRGVGVSTSAVISILAANPGAAALPEHFVLTTTQAASCFAAGKSAVGGALTAKTIALAEGGLRAMSLSQLKILAVSVAVAGVVAVGGSLLAQFVQQTDPPRDESVQQSEESPDRQPAPLPDVLAEVEAAWRQRQEETKSLRLAWETETYLPRDSVGYGPDRAPAEDTTIREVCELSLADGQFRFSNAGPKFVPAVGDLAPQLQLAVSNTERSVMFFGGEGGLDPAFPPVAFVGPPVPVKEASTLKHIQTLPLFATHSEIGLGDDLRKFRLSDAKADAPGILIIEKVSDLEHYTLWVDARRQYLPTRIEYRGRNGQLLNSIEVEYELSEEGFWQPQKWDSILYANTVDPQHPRILMMWIHGSLMKCELQPDLPPKEFAFEIPSGAMVTDNSTGEYYVLREDGTKRHITPEEQVPDVTYTDLLATESGDAVSAEYCEIRALVDQLGGLPPEQVAVTEGILRYFRATGKADAAAHLAMFAAYKLDKYGHPETAAQVLQSVADELEPRHARELLSRLRLERPPEQLGDR